MGWRFPTSPNPALRPFGDSCLFYPLIILWCGRQDLNLHAFRHLLLRHVCLTFHHTRILVWIAGFEPAVSRVQAGYATKLRYIQIGSGSRIRTYAYRIQSPRSYRLTIPEYKQFSFGQVYVLASMR